MATLDPVIKKLLNDYCKSQPALNIPGKPAAVSGIQLGDIIENALNHPKPGLDDETKELLNKFGMSQPALNVVGSPYGTPSYIMLGNILDAALLLAAPGSGLDDATKKMLNDFPKSQPALNIPGAPAATSSIALGDLIDLALT